MSDIDAGRMPDWQVARYPAGDLGEAELPARILEVFYTHCGRVRWMDELTELPQVQVYNDGGLSAACGGVTYYADPRLPLVDQAMYLSGVIEGHFAGQYA